MRILFLLCFAVGLAQSQSSLIVLKDGRYLAMRGDYEVFDTEVQFTDSSGELRVLPLSKVDLTATDRANDRIRRGLTPFGTEEEPGGDKKDGPQIHIEYIGPRDQAPNAAKEAEEPKEATADTDNIAAQVEDAFKSLEEAFGVEGDANQTQQMVDDYLQQMNSVGTWFMWLSMAGLILTSIISLITSIYLIIEGFKQDLMWGVGMVVSFLCLGPLFLVLMLAFVFLRYPGPKLLVLFLYFSPFIAIGAILLSLGFLVPA